jgi:hypothetical protein
LIEITASDMFLLLWAIVATLAYFKAKNEEKKTNFLLAILFDNPSERNSIFTQYDEAKRKFHEQQT